MLVWTTPTHNQKLRQLYLAVALTLLVHSNFLRVTMPDKSQAMGIEGIADERHGLRPRVAYVDESTEAVHFVETLRWFQSNPSNHGVAVVLFSIASPWQAEPVEISRMKKR